MPNKLHLLLNYKSPLWKPRLCPRLLIIVFIIYGIKFEHYTLTASLVFLVFELVVGDIQSTS